MIATMCRAALALLVSVSVGCGTMSSGTTQNLSMIAQPDDAKVGLYQLSGESVAQGEVSSGAMTVPRPKNLMPYLSVVSRDGYCPAYAITKVNPTPGYMTESILLAIPFIQVIGFVMLSVDNSTGGCCSVEPIAVELEEDSKCE